MVDHPSNDPEIASGVIDLAEKTVPHYLRNMMSMPGIIDFLDFALASLSAHEIMPKKSAAHFWVSPPKQPFLGTQTDLIAIIGHFCKPLRPSPRCSPLAQRGNPRVRAPSNTHPGALYIRRITP